MMTSEENDPYAVLGLPPGASSREIKARFRRLAKRFHPDLNAGSEWHQEQFRRIHAAYEAIDSVQRVEASDAYHAEAATNTSSSEDATVKPSESSWVHMGEPPHAVRMSFVSEAASPSRRRHGSGRRMGTNPQAGVITAGLAVAAFLLVVIVLAGPHGDKAFMASDIAQETVTPLATPNILPAVTPLIGAGYGNSLTASSVAVGVSKSPLTSQGGGYGSTVTQSGPAGGVSSAKFSVDEKYTHIDPTYTAVDSRYTTVDVNVMGVGSQSTGVNPQYTSIDPKLIQP